MSKNTKKSIILIAALIFISYFFADLENFAQAQVVTSPGTSNYEISFNPDNSQVTHSWQGSQRATLHYIVVDKRTGGVINGGEGSAVLNNPFFHLTNEGWQDYYFYVSLEDVQGNRLKPRAVNTCSYMTRVLSPCIIVQEIYNPPEPAPLTFFYSYFGKVEFRNLRTGALTVTEDSQSPGGTIFSNADQEIFRFNLTADPYEAVNVNRIVISISGRSNGLESPLNASASSNFRLYDVRDANAELGRRANVAGGSVSFENLGIFISAGDTKTFSVRADIALDATVEVEYWRASLGAASGVGRNTGREIMGEGSAVGNWLTIERKVVAPNRKDLSRYSGSEVFLVSDNSWQDVLGLVPITTWTVNLADNAAEYNNCQHIYGDDSNSVCGYPTLIYHNEGAGFDADSIIYFMQQYNANKVTVINGMSGELARLLTSARDLGPGLTENQIGIISPYDYFSYWQSFDTAVYVEDNYELALVASTFASLINAPLIIQGSGLDSENIFRNRNVILIGNINCPIGAICAERYNLEQLQRRYVELTSTDKIIVVNPNDLGIIVSEVFLSEKSANSISELYGKTSLTAPILASAKHELIIPVNFPRVYDDVDTADIRITSLISSFFPNIRDRRGILAEDGTNQQIYSYDLSSNQIIPITNLLILNQNPSIFNDKVVYVGGGDNFEQEIDQIYMYDFSTNIRTQITNYEDDNSVGAPYIYGNKIYYTKPFELGIFSYDILTGVKSRIYLPPIDTQIDNFKVYGNKLVWQENRNGNLDIFMYDLSTNRERQITSDPSFQLNPEIYGNKIIWEDNRNQNIYNIYLYDLSTNTERRIAEGNNPSIYNEKIVYARSNNIYLYDLSTNQEMQITNTGLPKNNPSIYMNKIVWQENRDGNDDVFVYDLTTNMERRVTDDAINQRAPLIFGNRIVWEQNVTFFNNVNGYLTIIASPSAIPYRRFSGIFLGYEIYNAADQIYSDLDNDYFLDMAFGRIMGITISDVSSYISRVLFYTNLPITNNVQLIQSSADLGPNLVGDWNVLFQNAGYNSQYIYDPRTAFDFDNPNMWENKHLIFYKDHADTQWAGIRSSRLPLLGNSLVLVDGCLTCATAGIGTNSFCMQSIRKGAIGYYGDTSVSTGGNMWINTANGIYYNGLDLGNAYAVKNNFYYIASFMLNFVGDPTLNIQPRYRLTQPLSTQ